jgi:hypothetical protein
MPLEKKSKTMSVAPISFFPGVDPSFSRMAPHLLFLLSIRHMSMYVIASSGFAADGLPAKIKPQRPQRYKISFLSSFEEHCKRDIYIEAVISRL